MINPFKKPFKHVEAIGDKLVSILVFGLFIFLFLFLFKPFGIGTLKPAQQFFITLGFGLVTIFMLFIFRYLLEPVISKSRWTLGKNLIWNLIIASSIGIANYCYICLIFGQVFIFKYLLYAIWAAILVGSIPVTLSYIIMYNRIYRNALKEAAISPEEVLWEDEVTLRAGNQKNELKLNPKNIIYLCSNDNYVTVVSIKGETRNKVTIRGTLKAAEAELKNNSRFMRCHKCYIVNLDFADFTRGHNQNMTIRLRHSETEIPISRSRAETVIKSIRRN
jgi:hypothetical protein